MFLKIIFSLRFYPALFKCICENNEFVKVIGRSVSLFCKSFCSSFFLSCIAHFLISCEHLRQWSRIEYFFLPPVLSCVVALLLLWLGDWELSITCWWTGSLLKKVHVGQKEMAGVWQAGWIEGGQAISHRLVGVLLLVKLEPRRYCPSCVKDIPRALFWL